MHRGAPRTRATSLLPRAIRGLFWLLKGGTPMHRGALCMGGISLGHRQEWLCHLLCPIRIDRLIEVNPQDT